MHISGQKEAIWNTFISINWFSHGVLGNQIQALSTTFRHRFKDFQGPSVFKDFPDLENLEKKFKDFQGPARALFMNLVHVNFKFQSAEFRGDFIHRRSFWIPSKATASCGLANGGILHDARRQPAVSGTPLSRNCSGNVCCQNVSHSRDS